ncbi:MAG: cytochrome P460 family protein [Deltaproteobacteria bacterium]|nr:cytochrome P460 family protein [Kofleriaceae bacterium]
MAGVRDGMTKLTWAGFITLVGALAACGGKQQAGGGGGGSGEDMSPMDQMMSDSMAVSDDDGSTFGPLEIGADWQTYVKVNTSPVTSETHGGRLVDTYVNQLGARAYLDEEAEIPIGTVLVKTSTEPDGSPGPLFVMAKKSPGFAPDQGDWYYAIQWANPPAAWAKKLGGPIYWRTPSKRAAYCVECHENYDRFLGGVPAPQRLPSLPE